MGKVSERNEVVSLLRGTSVVEISVRIWEPEGSTKSLLCVHGFAGSGWDFSILARTLVKSGITVIAPDILGRGKSSFFGDETKYTLRNYVASVDAGSQFQKSTKFHLGTSWGGVILLAYLSAKGWVSDGLILNDVPFESDSDLKKFRELLAQEAVMQFETREDAEEHVVRTRNMEFLDGQDRSDFVESRVMQVGQKWRMRYDPAVAAPFSNSSDFSILPLLHRLNRPTLMTFGDKSPYSKSPHLAGLTVRNPLLTVIKDMDDPHPPTLMKTNQILQIAGYLSQCG